VGIAKCGDPVTANGDQDAKACDGTSIGLEWTLIGHGTPGAAARQVGRLERDANAGSVFGIAFDKPALKDGCEIPRTRRSKPYP
jgi:hypothetical protein